MSITQRSKQKGHLWWKCGAERERERRKMDRAQEKWGIFSRVFSSNQLDKWIRKKDKKTQEMVRPWIV